MKNKISLCPISSRVCYYFPSSRYTEDNLAFAGLKGRDAVVSKTLLDMSDDSGQPLLSLHLALMTKRESGSCERDSEDEDDYYGGGWGRRGGRRCGMYDDEDGEDDDEDDEDDEDEDEDEDQDEEGDDAPENAAQAVASTGLLCYMLFFKSY